MSLHIKYQQLYTQTACFVMRIHLKCFRVRPWRIFDTVTLKPFNGSKTKMLMYIHAQVSYRKIPDSILLLASSFAQGALSQSFCTIVALYYWVLHKNVLHHVWDLLMLCFVLKMHSSFCLIALNVYHLPYKNYTHIIVFVPSVTLHAFRLSGILLRKQPVYSNERIKESNDGKIHGQGIYLT